MICSIHNFKYGEQTFDFLSTFANEFRKVLFNPALRKAVLVILSTCGTNLINRINNNDIIDIIIHSLGDNSLIESATCAMRALAAPLICNFMERMVYYKRKESDQDVKQDSPNHPENDTETSPNIHKGKWICLHKFSGTTQFFDSKNVDISNIHWIFYLNYFFFQWKKKRWTRFDKIEYKRYPLSLATFFRIFHHFFVQLTFLVKYFKKDFTS